jgi:hypothetical protein
MSKRFVGVGVLTLVVLMGLWAAVGMTVQAAPLQQEAPGLGASTTFVLMGPAVLTDTTFATAVLPSISGRDTARFTGYAGADVFVTVEGIDEDEGLEWTPQLSADRTNWADVTYEWWNGVSVLETVVGRKHTEDGTKFMMVKLAGDFLNIRGEATGTVTVTVSATYRFP